MLTNFRETVETGLDPRLESPKLLSQVAPLIPSTEVMSLNKVTERKQYNLYKNNFINKNNP